MKQDRWKQLNEDRRHMMGDYLKEMARTREAKVSFRETQPCSSCGEIGFVPTHHRYLCVFCWIGAGVDPDATYELFDTSYSRKRATDGQGLDKVNVNIRIGIEGVKKEPNVYSTKEFNARDYTQEELQAMIP